MEVAERPTFESEVSKRIYEYVERHGTANRHIVHQTVSAPAEEFERSHGVKGVGKSVSAEWARGHPELLRANDNGYAAPEKCLAAHLLPDDEPIHLEVCNAPFDRNVRQRLQSALDRGAYEQVLDPRGVQLYGEGQRATETMAKLRNGELPFPTLSGALEMLGVDEDGAAEIAEAMASYRERQEGATVRGDVV